MDLRPLFPLFVRLFFLALLMAMPLDAEPTRPSSAFSSAAFDDEALARLLDGDPRLARVAKDAAAHRLQILVGLVEKDADGRDVLRQVGFRADAEYFYPASSIKLFAAVVALEELNRLRQQSGHPIDAETGLVFHPLFADQERFASDPTNVDDRRVTVAHLIRKLFLVSDNDAFNRLYELVGQETLNRRLREVGLSSTQIIHRLSVARSADENRRSPTIEFHGANFRYDFPERQSADQTLDSEVAGFEVGRGFWRDGEVSPGAMDFRSKNRMSLADLQRGLCMVVRPDVDAGGRKDFALDEAQRGLLLEAMSQYPRESRNPVYDAETHPDAWGKFLLPGLLEVLPVERLRIYNKIGRAYGFSVENAWVVDRETGRSFFLAATLYTNADGILNDDQYEYETVADPFFAALGEAVARALLEERPADR